MQIEETTQTKYVAVEEQVLQLTLSIEEAKVLLALGATSLVTRTDFLQRSDKESKYKDNHYKCAALLGDMFHAAKDFCSTNKLVKQTD
jgi:hypothetical protein